MWLLQNCDVAAEVMWNVDVNVNVNVSTPLNVANPSYSYRVIPSYT